MAVPIGHGVLNKLCDAWGLPKTVMSLNLNVPCDGMAIVTVEFQDDKDSAEFLTKQYSLVELESQSCPQPKPNE